MAEPVTMGHEMPQHSAPLGVPGADSQDLDVMFDQHAGALFALARWILVDPLAAEVVVAEVFADACASPREDLVRAGGSVRYLLARHTFLRCIGHLPDASLPPATALALCTLGDCTYRQAGALVGLGGVDVPTLLEADLRGLHLDRRQPA